MVCGMGISILKYIWFLLILASGLVAVILGLSQYGIKIDFDSWARVSSEILNAIPALLNTPLVISYGFYAGLFVFVVFLVLFVMASMAGRKNKSKPDHALATDTQVPILDPIPYTEVSVPEPISSPDESLPDLDDSSDSPVEAKPFDQFSETIRSETFNRSNQDGDNSDPSECNEIEMHKMKVSTEEINGRWSHPNARGKIKISRVNNEFQVKWSGSPIQSTREEVEVSGKSLIINVDLDHRFGICNMLFRIPDVLN